MSSGDFAKSTELRHGLQGMRKQVEVPRSIPGLVTKRMLTMTFCEGTQITRLRGKVHSPLLAEALVSYAKKSDTQNLQ